MVKAEFEMAAGEFNLSGGSSKLLDGTFHYSSTYGKPEVRYDSTGFRGNLFMKQVGTETHISGINSSDNRWDLKMSNDLPTDLVIKMGAGEEQAQSSAP